MTQEPPQTPESDFTTLGQFLATNREQLRLQQSDVTNRLDIHERTYRGWEDGRRVPDDERLGTLARVFAVESGGAIDAEEFLAEALSLAQADRQKPRAQRMAERREGETGSYRVR